MSIGPAPKIPSRREIATVAHEQTTESETAAAPPEIKIGWLRRRLLLLILAPSAGVALGLWVFDLGGIGALVAVLALTGAFCLLLMNAVARPLERLVSAVQRFQQGEQDARIPQLSRGEIGVLEQGFNQFADRAQHGQRNTSLAIRKATLELQERVKEIDIKNRELEIARARAEKADLAKTRFLANMSHELRTPMNAIIGFTDLLAEYEVDAAHTDYINTIKRSASDLLVLINEILDYSKIESGELKVEQQEFDFYEVIDDTVNLLSKSAYDKKLDFLLYIDPEIPLRIASDPLRMKQAVINLVSNAIKFTNRGHVALEIHAGRNPDKFDAHYLEFKVIDTGIGIPLQSQNRIFEPFLQHDASLTRMHKGTGLGLSITKYFVEKMNGEIGFSSEPDKGSIFWFTLPYTIGKLIHYHRAQPLAPLFEGGAALIYDKNAARLAYTRDLLTAWDIKVKAVQRAELFLSEVKSPAYRLVLYYLDQNSVDTDLQVSMHHLTTSGNVIRIFFHNSNYYDDLSPTTGLLHLSSVIAPNELFHHIRERLHGSEGKTDEEKKPDIVSAVPVNLDGLKVLIADDNDINQRLMQVYITRNGGEATIAKDGQAAVELAARQSFDVILMDVHMPRLNGIAAMKAIKLAQPRLPILAVTADASTQTIESYISSGFDACLLKPVTEKKLLGMIQSALGGNAPTGNGQVSVGKAEKDDSADLKVIDKEKAIRIASGNERMAHELFNMLLADLKSKRAQLLANADNRDQARELAHKIHGGAKYCAAERLQWYAANIESAVNNNADEKTIRKLVVKLSTAIGELLNSKSPYANE